MTPGEKQYLDRLKDEYVALLHAMQTGVKFTMQLDQELRVDPEKQSTSPKHLRTGVNSSLIHASAVADILIEKKIITEEEFYKKLVEIAREEVAHYEKDLSERTGKSIRLL